MSRGSLRIETWSWNGSEWHRFQPVHAPGADPDDVAQDAMVAAITHLDRFDPSRGSMEAWLWRIVLNRGRDAGRVRLRNSLLLHRIGLLQRRDFTASAFPESLVVDRMRDQKLLAAVRRSPSAPSTPHPHRSQGRRRIQFVIAGTT